MDVVNTDIAGAIYLSVRHPVGEGIEVLLFMCGEYNADYA
jgi:hypothetical protein